jgi:hypothetical protein
VLNEQEGETEEGRERGGRERREEKEEKRKREKEECNECIWLFIERKSISSCLSLVGLVKLMTSGFTKFKSDSRG